jgi:hypothetical protein
MADLIAIEPETVDAGVVALLETALGQARDGEIASIGLAIVYRDGVAGAKWTTGGSFIRILGAVDRLRHKLNLDMDAQ